MGTGGAQAASTSTLAIGISAIAVKPRGASALAVDTHVMCMYALVTDGRELVLVLDESRVSRVEASLGGGALESYKK